MFSASETYQSNPGFFAQYNGKKINSNNSVINNIMNKFTIL